MRMAVEMRERVVGLVAVWRKRGFDARLRGRNRPGLRHDRGDRLRGAVGLWGDRHRHESRRAAVRRGGAGQILVSRRLLGLVEDLVDAEPVGDLTLKGFARPVATYSLRALRAE